MGIENLNILLAEDNPAIADVLRFNLERAGFCVTVARDGRQAIEAIDAERFDAIISDYQMPHVDGGEFCRHARQDQRHDDTSIFLCSAKSFELDINQMCKDLRLAGVFFKPYSPREVVQTVQAAVEERCAAT